MIIDCLPASEIISDYPCWWFRRLQAEWPSVMRNHTARCSVGAPNWWTGLTGIADSTGVPSYWTRRWQRKFLTFRTDCTA